MKDEDPTQQSTAINVRTLQDLDLKALNLKELDGKNFKSTGD